MWVSCVLIVINCELYKIKKLPDFFHVNNYPEK